MSGKQNRRARRNTALGGHTRTGKVLKPPLRTLPMKPQNWLRDDVPDLLWPAFLAVEYGRKSLFVGGGIQGAMREALEDIGEGDGRRVRIDGRLSTLERMTEPERAAVLEALAAVDYEQAVPEALAHALGMYPEAPGSWILDPWKAHGLAIDPTEAERRLGDVIDKCASGQSAHSTWLKAGLLRAYLVSGKVSVPSGSDVLDLLVKYPNDLSDEELPMVESTIRSMVGGLRGAEESDDALRESRLSWASAFWRANWQLYAPHRGRRRRESGGRDRGNCAAAPAPY